MQQSFTEGLNHSARISDRGIKKFSIKQSKIYDRYLKTSALIIKCIPVCCETLLFYDSIRRLNVVGILAYMCT